ncbi:hypothetical protein AJ80_02773 [Polytolypa hystricis UAMH7299]|uniref:Exocyst complex component Sec8 n=1 Tax=Polytolypa hystricis (strain UAMH7299) TaxID=1447883 RepID=A0A2B7YQK7_POLH7|nr:hypothetical protein AJ80_02773 [Polytolypa hystricis UAMH7299]
MGSISPMRRRKRLAYSLIILTFVLKINPTTNRFKRAIILCDRFCNPGIGLCTTADRDRKQSLTLLEKGSLLQYGEFDGQFEREKIVERLFVPQLWGMILGEGKYPGRTVITTGSIARKALMGPSLREIDKLVSSIIQINWENEVYEFPFHQCNSWFGLMKRYHLICRKLANVEERLRLQYPRAGNYLLLTENGVLVQSCNWGMILQSVRNKSSLVLKMERFTNTSYKNRLQGANKNRASAVAQVSVPDAVNEESRNGLGASGSSSDTHVVQQANETGGATIVGIFLKEIRASFDGSLSFTLLRFDALRNMLNTRNDELSQQITPENNNPVAAAQRSLSKDNLIAAEAFVKSSHSPLKLFVSDETCLSDSPAIYNCTGERSTFCLRISQIHLRATRLKVGVDGTFLTNNSGTEDPSTKHGMVLLEETVNALREIFKMFVAGATSAAMCTNASFAIMSFVTRHKLVIEHLETARDQLITEADGDAKLQDDILGPLVTPETMMILLMERLSQGVFRESNVNFIGIYEGCLQNLIQQVEDAASRPLLNQIHYFQEKVDIIMDVLRQQDQVLRGFGQILSPHSYSKPGKIRSERYQYEANTYQTHPRLHQRAPSPPAANSKAARNPSPHEIHGWSKPPPIILRARFSCSHLSRSFSCR